jgi:cyclopropane-fatty-acyl-phospholipid synthase
MTVASINGEKSRRLALAARQAIEQIGSGLDLDLWIRLWDGSRIPLGRNVTGDLTLSISSPGVISSILRWPTLDRMLRHYLHGQIDFEGGTLIDLGNLLAFQRTRSELKQLNKWHLFKCILPFFLVKADKPERGRGYGKGEVGTGRAGRDEKSYIQFHYDVGNAFYRLFLDARMIYTCAYFTDSSNSLDRAQRDKLEMICRKLRLQPGERFLDIGCGWGGLVCYAAENFGVEAHGVTLSQEQFDYAQAEIERRGLTDRVRVELRDYRDLTGKFDKIASIGMYEAIGVAAIPEYLHKIHSLLSPSGLFLNHGITRRSKRKKRRFANRPEQRALLRYIFPGGELDDIGNTIALLEQARFEVHDVEGWRDHYAQTTRHWCERLTANREKAVELVGDQVYRIWIAYLAGSSLAFARGSVRIYQTLVSRAERGPPPVPASRADLYPPTDSVKPRDFKTEISK